MDWISLKCRQLTVTANAQVIFMCPPGPSHTFYWPNKDDICWVPFQQISCKVAAPTTTTERCYTFDAKDIAKIEKNPTAKPRANKKYELRGV